MRVSVGAHCRPLDVTGVADVVTEYIHVKFEVWWVPTSSSVVIQR